MGFTYTRTFTDREEKILRDRIIIEPSAWIDEAINGKLNNSSKTLVDRRRKELIDSGATTIPAKDDDIIDNAFADVNYKDAKTRNASA